MSDSPTILASALESGEIALPLHSNHYDPGYYQSIRDGSLKSAREVVPQILEYCKPSSVADVGCGSGAWLSVFQEQGVQEVWGTDGKWLRPEELLISQSCFQTSDLANPIRLTRTFDLAICLEVAEHLTQSAANVLIDSLTVLAPVILFSAAIPGQGGVEHLNEQWPSYWANLFAIAGFVPVDCLRRALWNNNAIDYWYTQNIMFYVQKSKLDNYPKLKAESQRIPVSLGHPKCFLDQKGGEMIELKRAVVEQAHMIASSDQLIAEYEVSLANQAQRIQDLESFRPGAIALKKLLRALPSLITHSFMKSRLTPADKAPPNHPFSNKIQQ